MSLAPLLHGIEIAIGVLGFIAIAATVICLIENWMHRNASFDS